MTVADWVAVLRELGSPAEPPGGPVAGELAAQLPPAHRQLLESVNGVATQRGAFRLMGFGRSEPALDLPAWNAQETWRFAWDDRIDPYLFFGETGWGDQYAYRRGESGQLEPEVHFLEGTLLRSEVIAGSFEEFMEGEFLRNARDPYDPFTVEALARLGPLDAGQHWAYAPSIALGGVESVDNVVVLPAVAAMTIAGDVATALAMSEPGTSPTQVSPWVDDRGRSRMRVDFDRQRR